MVLTTSAYPYPLLEENRFDYKNASYEINQVKEDKNHIYLEHHLVGAKFIVDLLKAKKAKFVTTVVVKDALFRKTFSEYEEVISINKIIQKIPLLNNEINHSFFAHIVYVGDDEEFVLDYDDLDEFWQGRKIKLFKGSILAKDGWRDLDFGVGDILKIIRSDIPYSFDTDISFENGGKIICKMNKELFDKMRLRSYKDPHVKSIISHILSEAFFKLSKLDEIPSNFNSIIYKLKSLDMDIKDENFNPIRAALLIMPHTLGDIDE